MIKLNRLFVV